jgi:hypothetical protein
MATHQRHHYVPQFYLRSWIGADGKLACYSWLRGTISVSRLSPKSVAYENGLYSLEHGPGERRQIVERDFLAKVDEDAAKALQSMQATGTAYLDPQAKAHWAVFLLSMRVRSPPSVRDVRRQATVDLLEVLKEDPEEYDRLRKPGDPTRR